MNLDVLINIASSPISIQTGHRSKYVDTAHPGTNNKIKGWEWGKFMWPVYSELSEFSYVPTIYDAELVLDKLYYQSGFGYEDDILLKNLITKEVEHLKKWTPIINSGTYHIHNKEWYLFSDQYITEMLELETGEFFHVLGNKNKALTPVFVRNYNRDLSNSQLLISKELRYTVELSSDGTINPPEEGHFTIDTITNPAEIRIVIHQADATFDSITETFPITADTTNIQLSAFPVSSSNHNVNHWSLDEDLGVLTRIDAASDGLNDTDVVIVFLRSYAVTYEPEFSSGEIAAETANINPLHVGTNRGFIQITTEILDPFSIELEADLPIQFPSNFPSNDYILNLGNNATILTATVRNQVGSLLEGIRVFFDWEHEPPGGYGDYTDDPSSITNHNGEAYMSYSAPSSINDLGTYVHIEDILVTNGKSTLLVPSTTDTSIDKIFLYAVDSGDKFFGLDSVALNSYWSPAGYFADEQITEAGINSKDYEEMYRQHQGQYSLNDFHYPFTRPFELDTDVTGHEIRGRKTMIFVERDDTSRYVHPNTGDRSSLSEPVWKPIKPENIDINSSTITYDFDLTDINPDIFKYFVVANKTVKIKAWAKNAAGQRIFSNEILLNIMLPDSLNGVYYTEALDSLSAEHLAGLLSSKSTVPADINEPYEDNIPGATTDVTPVAIIPDADKATIPIGFRIGNPQGITVASLLDRITFLTKENN